MTVFKNDEFKELEKTIKKMLSEADKDEDMIGLMDALWPAVMRCETFFRKSNDIRALEFQVGLLTMMQNNLYLETYWTYAYTICKRILEIDPNHKKAKKAIENIIPIWDCRMSNDPEKWKEVEKKKDAGEEYELPRRTRSETEKMLEEEFKKNKEGNYDCFLDDWEARYKIEDDEDSKVDPDRGDGYLTSSKGRKY